MEDRDLVTEIREHAVNDIFKHFTDVQLIEKLYELKRTYGSWEQVREVLCLNV